jgi:hypothetical protein
MNQNRNTFELIKEELIKKYESKFDFSESGSNISLLADVLAYVTQVNIDHMKQGINESFFSTASLRNSVVAHAKLLNYTPTSIISANIPEAVLGAIDKDKLDLEKKETIGSTTISFQKLDGVFYQGKLKQHTLSSNDDIKKPLILTEEGIDTTTIIVKKVSDDGETSFTLSDKFDLNNIKQYFIEEENNKTYSIKFMPNLNLEQGTEKLEISYIYNSKGDSSEVNGRYVNPVDNSPIFIDNGKAIESIESIKFNAPKFRATQGRLVTVQDYEVYIPHSTVWGGEDNIPPEYGTVFICPDNTLDQKTKNAHIENIKKKSIIGVKIKFVDRTHIYCNFKIKLTIPDWKNTEFLRENIPSLVDKYVKEHMNNIKISNISSIIDKDSVASSNLIEIEIGKKLLGINGTYSTKFLNKIIPGSVRTDKIDDVSYIDIGTGELFKQTGDMINNKRVGSVNYDNGEITMNIEFSKENTPKVWILPQEKDIMIDHTDKVISSTEIS